MFVALRFINHSNVERFFSRAIFGLKKEVELLVLLLLDFSFQARTSVRLLKAIAVSANKYMYRANMHVYGRYLYDIYVYRKKCSSSYRNIHTMQKHRQWCVHCRLVFASGTKHSKLKHIESVVFAMLSRRPIPNFVYSPTGHTYTTLRMFVHNAPICENFSASLSLIFACKKESQVIIC